MGRSILTSNCLITVSLEYADDRLPHDSRERESVLYATGFEKAAGIEVDQRRLHSWKGNMHP